MAVVGVPDAVGDEAFEQHALLLPRLPLVPLLGSHLRDLIGLLGGHDENLAVWLALAEYVGLPLERGLEDDEEEHRPPLGLQVAGHDAGHGPGEVGEIAGVG